MGLDGSRRAVRALAAKLVRGCRAPRHYDLGNELFELMLDETMTYSCAVFEHEDEPLADAQRRKYRMLCDKLSLVPGDRVLEIGCGWGGFAALAAAEYGCSVTGLTISAEQAAVARQRTKDLDVTILEEDHREHRGTYTKIVSIEMLEAIGERQFPVYFEAIDRLLEPGGTACVQTILHEVDEIGPHYAETLRRWRASFNERIDEVRALGYDGRFERTWNFYLASCEAGFRTRALRDVHLTLRRPLEG